MSYLPTNALADPEILEVEEVDDRLTDDEGAVPLGPYAQASRAVMRREIGHSSDTWEANLELEAFFRAAEGVRQTIEHVAHLTGGQSYALMCKLQRGCRPSNSLTIAKFPKSIALKDRKKRDEYVVKSDDILPLIKTARAVMMGELNDRFREGRPSDTRLVQIYLSKQMDPSVLIPPAWQSHAKAMYLGFLREISAKIVTPRRRSPRGSGKKKRRRETSLFMDADSDSADELRAPDQSDPTASAADDVVTAEAKAWKGLQHPRAPTPAPPSDYDLRLL